MPIVSIFGNGFLSFLPDDLLEQQFGDARGPFPNVFRPRNFGNIIYLPRSYTRVVLNIVRATGVINNVL